MHTHPSRRVRFGAFELDLSTGELRSMEALDPTNKVLLREQVFQVLGTLLDREGKIVTREEIKIRLWANDTVVDFDHSINATIKALAARQLLHFGRQGEVKGCTSSIVVGCPQPTAMRLHNGAADGQPHAAALGLGSKEGRKDLVNISGW
jgi:hypothetical protein